MANKTYDLGGLIVANLAVSVTASSTPVEIKGLSIGSKSFIAVINNGAVTGTTDGSNYYSAQLEASDLVGGTYYPIGNAVKFPATAGQFQVGFTSEQLNDAVVGADNFRLTVSKIGTTATAVTVSAFLSVI